jgi:hypothetical protein
LGFKAEMTELGVIEGGAGSPPDPASAGAESFAAAAAAAAAAVVPAPKKYRATVFPSGEINPEFGGLIGEIEKLLGHKVWVLVHQGTDEKDRWDTLTQQLSRGFRDKKADIAPNEKVGLLIESPGGDARSAYEIVRLFQRRTPEFVTIVPYYAKSAATLIAIGGSEIIMGMEAELGPLDVQMYDTDKEEWHSALNAVQSFERLNAYALTAYDQAMQLFGTRTGKKPQFLMTYALQYATSIVGPMADKIDTLEVTSKARELKVAEDYAIRVMRANYPWASAQEIARKLVERYSTHGFIIDREEAGTAAGVRSSPFNLGLKVTAASPELEGIFTRLAPYLDKKGPIVGRIVEVSP